MSIKLVNQIRGKLKNLPPVRKAVLLAIAWCAFDDGHTVGYFTKRIAEDTGYSVERVRQTLQILEREGYISRNGENEIRIKLNVFDNIAAASSSLTCDQLSTEEVEKMIEREWPQAPRPPKEMLKGVDQDMDRLRAQGYTTLKAQYIALLNAQSNWLPLSPEWRWYQPRVYGAYRALLVEENSEHQVITSPSAEELALLPELREKLGECTPPLAIAEGQADDWEIVKQHIQGMRLGDLQREINQVTGQPVSSEKEWQRAIDYWSQRALAAEEELRQLKAPAIAEASPIGDEINDRIINEIRAGSGRNA